VFAASKPARTEPAAAHCLTSDMVLVHKVFRRELRLLADLIAAVDAVDGPRAEVLAAH
jgi:hypothetical protein